MGLSEGYKRAAEARKAEWQELIARFQRANLPVPDAKDFSASRPITRIAHDLGDFIDASAFRSGAEGTPEVGRALRLDA